MVGTIESGTKAHALEIMVAGQSMAVHDSFEPGEYFELDAYHQIIVNQDVSKIISE